MNLAPSQLQQRPAGLVARLENTRVPLPLKALEIETEVTGDLVSVELNQLFLQDHSDPLNCTYTFPLPADAAVHRCEMCVGDRVIEAKVMTREKARRLFEEKKNEGRRAALAEMDRENLFNLELGNLQPGDLVRIRFAYVQRLDHLDDLRTLRIPLTPSVRYVPGRALPRANRGSGSADDTDQVPDASRLSPPRIDSLHPDAATLSARVRIELPRDQLTGLRSPSHTIDILGKGEDTVITLCGTEEIPNRDFVLEWTTTPCLETSARAWMTRHHDRPYALVELDGGPLPADHAVEDRDVYILLDRSGSMSGEPWEAACRAVNSFAGALPSSTRIDLTLFESNFTHFTDEPLPATAFLRKLGGKASTLISLGTSGGTRLNPALKEVIARRHRFSGGRPAVLLLITDGMVANERAILDLARKSDTTLHLVGIGLAPNDAMRSVATATGGQAVFCSSNDDLEQILSRFSSRLAKPLLENIVFPDGWRTPEEETLTTLYPLEQRLVILQGEKGAMWSALVADRDGSPIEIETVHRDVKNCALPLLWARERIRTLENLGRSEEALNLSLSFNLPSSQTSFVAWDRAEQVTVAARHLHQPSLDLESGDKDVFSGGVLRECAMLSLLEEGLEMNESPVLKQQMLKMKETRSAPELGEIDPAGWQTSDGSLAEDLPASLSDESLDENKSGGGRDDSLLPNLRGSGRGMVSDDKAVEAGHTQKGPTVSTGDSNGADLKTTVVHQTRERGFLFRFLARVLQVIRRLAGLFKRG